MSEQELNILESNRTS